MTMLTEVELNNGNFTEAKSKLRDIPTVEARPVVHGKWEEYPSPLHRRCSVCKMEYDKLTNQFKGNYCPNCGADMRKKVI